MKIGIGVMQSEKCSASEAPMLRAWLTMTGVQPHSSKGLYESLQASLEAHVSSGTLVTFRSETPQRVAERFY